ncbi:japanin-like isoform X2 [Dermacentor variabilis]|uniref:japanin-like isoform X2 n=1 Tax=Dermacentor variabilis TaxID=34621 RepID=UPI003F5C16EF
MALRCFSLLAIYIFVFAMAGDHGNTQPSSYIYQIPANSSEYLYLVGYSSSLNRSGIRCVRSMFASRTGNCVKRYVFMRIYEQFQILTINVTIPDSPIIFNINISYEPDALANQTGALPTYQVIYYNNDTMILGNQKATVSETSICSLWVTAKYYRETEEKLDEITKMYFRTNCNDTKLVPYPGDCRP